MRNKRVVTDCGKTGTLLRVIKSTGKYLVRLDNGEVHEMVKYGVYDLDKVLTKYKSAYDFGRDIGEYLDTPETYYRVACDLGFDKETYNLEDAIAVISAEYAE